MATKHERIQYTPTDYVEHAINQLIERSETVDMPRHSRTEILSYFVDLGVRTWLKQIAQEQSKSAYDKLSEIGHRMADRAQEAGK